jgi:hypothetical protein
VLQVGARVDAFGEDDLFSHELVAKRDEALDLLVEGEAATLEHFARGLKDFVARGADRVRRRQRLDRLRFVEDDLRPGRGGQAGQAGDGDCRSQQTVANGR